MATIVEGDFEWDASKDLVKHGVSFEEATTVFDDPHAIDAPDRYHSDRFVIIGMSTRTRVVFVVHVLRGDRLRIVSARRASAAQRRMYEKEG